MRIKGRIISGVGGLYSIRTEDGGIIECPARGLLRYGGEKPLTGDLVVLTEDNGYILDSIVERKNSLIRPPIANVSKLFIVTAAAQPKPILLNIDKLTCIAEHNGISPVIIVTKSDVDKENADNLLVAYSSCGYRTFATGSGFDYTKVLEYIKSECREDVCCFAGASGVGKSTLMTRLFPQLELKTGEISRKIQRGKHTTRQVTLYPLGELFGDNRGGFIADTPGFSMLDFVQFGFFELEVLPNTFPEFEESIGRCRYTKCTHLCEEGCDICRRLNEGKIQKSRHDSYVSIYNELKGKKKWK